MKKSYKLVLHNEVNDTYISLFARGDALIIYELGKPVQTPKWLARLGQYPFLFDMHIDIWNYVIHDHRLHRVKILTCECEDQVSDFNFYLVNALTYGRSLKYSKECFPAGTTSYKTVIPISASGVYEFFSNAGWNTRLAKRVQILPYRVIYKNNVPGIYHESRQSILLSENNEVMLEV